MPNEQVATVDDVTQSDPAGQSIQKLVPATEYVPAGHADDEIALLEQS